MKTLRRAIFDAFVDKEEPVSAELMDQIEAKVKEYCKQKFKLFLAQDKSDKFELHQEEIIKELWDELFKEKQ